MYESDQATGMWNVGSKAASYMWGASLARDGQVECRQQSCHCAGMHRCREGQDARERPPTTKPHVGS